MTWQEHLQRGTKKLADAHIENPSAEARMLWEYASDRSYAEWLVHPLVVTGQIVTRYDEAVGRRTQREPFHYIVGQKEFMGIALQVSPAVLIPRPETEILVHTVLAHLSPEVDTLVDVGTGSGAIALALRHALISAKIRIIGIDRSESALLLAAANGARLGLPVEWRQGNLLDPIGEPVDVVVANLPYVSTRDRNQLAAELHFEPESALFAGPIGTELIGQLIEVARGKLSRGGHIFLEVGQGQASWTNSQLRQKGFLVGPTVQDYDGIERVVWARRED